MVYIFQFNTLIKYFSFFMVKILNHTTKVRLFRTIMSEFHSNVLFPVSSLSSHRVMGGIFCDITTSNLTSIAFVCLVGLIGFLTSSSTTRLYRGRAPRQSVRQFYGETMTSVSAGHIILTPTQPVGSGWPQRELNPGSPHQESGALPTKLSPPPPPLPTSIAVRKNTKVPICKRARCCSTI